MNEKIVLLRKEIRLNYSFIAFDSALCTVFVWLAFSSESILWIIANIGIAAFFLYHAWQCLKDIERRRSEIRTARDREEQRRMLGR